MAGSTGTINAELLSRFIPSVSEATYESFADLQREDGLIPYKVTDHGPVFRQIQLVTPLARSVWNHYSLHGRNEAFPRKMYGTMGRYDQWLAEYRNTRGTGCVEAFCTFDTGHDLSPRFWHVPDTPHLGDAKQYDPTPTSGVRERASMCTLGRTCRSGRAPSRSFGLTRASTRIRTFGRRRSMNTRAANTCSPPSAGGDRRSEGGQSDGPLPASQRWASDA